MNLLQVFLFPLICIHFEAVTSASVHRGNGYQGGHRGSVSQGSHYKVTNFKRTTYQVSNYEGSNHKVGSYQGGSNYNKGCQKNCGQGSGQVGVRVDAGLQGLFGAMGNIATSVGTLTNKIIKDKINGIFANCILNKG